jgi:hypothetical protein
LSVVTTVIAMMLTTVFAMMLDMVHATAFAMMRMMLTLRLFYAMIGR